MGFNVFRNDKIFQIFDKPYNYFMSYIDTQQKLF